MKFLYPVPANSIVTQTFQQHVDRARAHGWTNYYGGIDWAVNTGTPVKAAQKGQIILVRSDATGYGIHVRIQHDKGYLTIYGHLASFNVAIGDEVTPGQVIGLSDNTGNSTGPHLHFELRQNNVPIDPQPLLVTSLEEDTATTTTTTTTPVTTGSGTPPAAFPELPKAIVTAVALNIRAGPGIENPIIGLVQNGVVFEVMKEVKIGDDIWLHIGYNQYVAQRFQGNVFARWV